PDGADGGVAAGNGSGIHTQTFRLTNGVLDPADPTFRNGQRYVSGSLSNFSAPDPGMRSSGRRSRVRDSAWSRRHAAMRAWSPDSRTSGTSRPRHDAGFV